MSQCRKVGFEYAAKLPAHNLPPRDAWMGMQYQLYPKLIHGTVAITHPQKKLEDTIQAIWYKLLLSLKVNRHITKEFQMLPTMFQGFTLPNPNIDVLSWKLHLVQNEWGTDSVMGNLLSQDYQVFQVEVGLHGNMFDYSFEDYGDLATHGFFRNMWQLLQLFGVWFQLCNTFDIPLLRQDHRAVMEAIVDTGIFLQGEHVRINRVCHHKKITV